MPRTSTLQRSIHSRPGIGITASVVQRKRLLFHTIATDQPSLVLLLRGRKTVSVGGRRFVLRPGDAVALDAGTVCDVENATEEGLFDSRWIVVDPSLLSWSEPAFPVRPRGGGVAPLKGLGTEFDGCFERAAQAIRESEGIPDAVAACRVRELLSWVAHAGFVFGARSSETLARKVRLEIASAPHRDWIEAEVARSFAMSGATFRRHLAGEGKSFRALLADVRMSHALALLQATDIPISRIADQVGYASASRFSVRFRARFGFPPREVRDGVETESSGP